MARFSPGRRKLLASGAVLGAGGLAFGLTDSDKGRNHNAYFQGLSGALDRAGLARPTLVIDRQKLLANANTLRDNIGGRYAYRVVAKSLPSLPLLAAVMQSTATDRLMVFHQPFLNLIAASVPRSQLLLGKPMPVAAAARFYQDLAGGAFDPAAQLQWLVDSPRRLLQYRDLAQQRQQKMLINLELDVGLHRGGIASSAELAEALQIIALEPLMSFSGFVGYEPHVAKMPGLLGGPSKAFAKAQKIYSARVAEAETLLGHSLENHTLNAAGSPTYQLYDGRQVANELAAGSALVKPTDFDLDTLRDHEPAAFIATPVIKSQPTAQVPGIEALAGLMALFNPNRQQAFFIYGGYWKARPESPQGLSNHPLYGRSTNQEMLTGSTSINLQQDDWVFLRPSQSEHVFLQFGDIAVYDEGEIVEMWPVFSQGA